MTHRVQLAVEYAGHVRRYYPIRYDQGWKLDTERRVIVIGRGLPRTEIPLDNVLSWDIETLPEKPDPDPESRRVDPLNLSAGMHSTVPMIQIAANGCDDCSVEPGEPHRHANCPGNLRAVERKFADAMAHTEVQLRAARDLGPTHIIGRPA